MNAHEIRTLFLKYFEDHGHEVVESSPVIPQNDPTLLFTNAGMNQFKDVLLGNEIRDYKRAASVQKCIRAGGKHNDLDDVGKDARHLTFFEMLGNWSFGDYYKEKAIEWAWDMCINVLKLDKSRLYVTTYKDDDESYEYWRDEMGVPEERILRLGDIEKGDEENFWSMGPTGPCGPCTEIHYDLHPDKSEFEFVEGYDDDRVIEFWNLVFMEFDRDETGELHPLPMRSVDTGMGLDRIAMVMAGQPTVFHTDLFTPIFAKTRELLGEGTSDWDEFYARDNFSDYAVIADHVRTVTFSLADGAKFSNEGRGSVLRSILRRAVRHGRRLGFEGPFMHEVSKAVVDNFGDIYPELAALGDRVAELIRIEEERFFRTIDSGIELFNQAAEKLAEAGESEIPGDVVFNLHATHGFPPDMTRVMAEERDMTIDIHGYKQNWREHQEASKGKDVHAGTAGIGDWTTIHEGPTSEFTGYNETEGKTRIMKARHVDGDTWELLLEATPFYAEAGGQIADEGDIRAMGGELAFHVDDVQRGNIGWVHTARVTAGEATDEALASDFFCRVDVERRHNIESNHTATHLLHAALRNGISDAIFQSGSLVAEDRLRFDFSYGQPLTREQVEEIEATVNRQIREGHEVIGHTDVDRDTAVNEMGAMAIFGEKYGDKVRVVEIPGESVELCGGTHVANTRDINLFRVTSESGVAAGIRRIEAVTRDVAFRAFKSDRERLDALAEILKSDVNSLLDRARALTEERSELARQVDRLTQKLASASAGDIVDEAVDVDGVKVVAKSIKVDTRDQLLAYADNLKQKMNDGVVLLAAEIDGKPALLCMVGDQIWNEKKVKAGDLINDVASHIGGRGGGRPTLAQAGGSNVDGLPAAVDGFVDAVRARLGA